MPSSRADADPSDTQEPAAEEPPAEEPAAEEPAPERRRDDFPIAPRAKRKGATPGVGARLDDEGSGERSFRCRTTISSHVSNTLCGISVYDYYR